MKLDLVETIKCGESSVVGFGLEDVPVERIARDVIGMANLKGGCLVLGVESDGTVFGIKRVDLEKRVMDALVTKVHPAILPFYEEVALDCGKRLAVVSISEGTNKPYVLRHRGQEKVYIRIGKTTRAATREQQSSLYRHGNLQRTDLLPATGAGIEALDRGRLSDYLRFVTQDSELPESDVQWMSRLTSLGLIADVPDETAVATIAGLLLFGYAPRLYLKQAGIRVVVYKGKNKSYDAIYDSVLDGPVIPLWVTVNGSRVRADKGLLEKVDDVLKPYIVAEGECIGEGFRRESGQIISREVIREILLNAIGHRDWTRFVDIELSIYSDRLELISPGSLPNRMTIEKMIAGQRSRRNPILVDILRDYGYVDARGMGIRNKVIPIVKRMTGQDPVFEETDDYLKTTIPAVGGAP